MKLPLKPPLLALLCSAGLLAASGVLYVKSQTPPPLWLRHPLQCKPSQPLCRRPLRRTPLRKSISGSRRWRCIRMRCCLRY